MKDLLIFTFFIILSSCGTISDMPRRDGTCNIKCMMPPLYETKLVETIVYTGEDEQPPVILEEVVVQQAEKKWVKKKADRNCLAADPEDCLVWCLVEVPEVVQTIETIDTTQTDDYEIKMEEKRVIVREGGSLAWQETVCENNITEDLNSRIQMNLIGKGYDIGKQIPDGQWDEGSDQAMKNYVLDNELPIGSSYLKVALGSLGIDEYVSYFSQYRQ